MDSNGNLLSLFWLLKSPYPGAIRIPDPKSTLCVVTVGCLLSWLATAIPTCTSEFFGGWPRPFPKPFPKPLPDPLLGGPLFTPAPGVPGDGNPKPLPLPGVPLPNPDPEPGVPLPKPDPEPGDFGPGGPTFLSLL